MAANIAAPKKARIEDVAPMARRRTRLGTPARKAPTAAHGGAGELLKRTARLRAPQFSPAKKNFIYEGRWQCERIHQASDCRNDCAR